MCQVACEYIMIDFNDTWINFVNKGPLIKVSNKRQLADQSTPLIPIGVAAGPLFSSSWVEVASLCLFDIITYKTIRSRMWPCHEPPNSLHCKANSTLPGCYESIEHPISDRTLRSLTSFYGIPSMGPQFIMKDIQKAASHLTKDQLFVISLTGSPPENPHNIDIFKAIIEDYANTAVLAMQSHPFSVLELNLSCPNISKEHPGESYTNEIFISEVLLASALKIQQNIHLLHEYNSRNPRHKDNSTSARYPSIESAHALLSAGIVPLALKVGSWTNEVEASRVLETAVSVLAPFAASCTRLHAIVGINSPAVEVRTAEGHFAHGEKGRKVGLCGAEVHEAALQFVRTTRQVISAAAERDAACNNGVRNDFSTVEVWGCGGLQSIEAIERMKDAGANVCLIASSFLNGGHDIAAQLKGFHLDMEPRNSF